MEAVPIRHKSAIASLCVDTASRKRLCAFWRDFYSEWLLGFIEDSKFD